MARADAAVVAVKMPLVGPVDRRRRVVYGTIFDLLAVDAEVHQLVLPIDSLYRPWRDQHLLSWPPVLRIDEQVVDTPIRVLDEKILDVTDFAVECVDMVSGHGRDAAKMRILVVALCADHVFLTPPGFR